MSCWETKTKYIWPQMKMDKPRVDLAALGHNQRSRQGRQDAKSAKRVFSSFILGNANHQNLLAARRFCRVGVLAHHCFSPSGQSVGEYAHPTLGCGRGPPCALGLLAALARCVQLLPKMLSRKQQVEG